MVAVTLKLQHPRNCHGLYLSLWTGSQVGYRGKKKVPRSARSAYRFSFLPFTPLGSLFAGCSHVSCWLKA